jgi:hypothetical protein
MPESEVDSFRVSAIIGCLFWRYGRVGFQLGRPGRVAEVARHPVGSDGWYAAVAGANLANGDHMAEEEREGLTDFRRLAGLQQRHNLGVAFAGYEARNFAGVRPVDKDPAAYVSQVEEGGSPLSDGSLGIGGLRRT